MRPKILRSIYQENRYNDLTDIEKVYYCAIEEILLDYLQNEITFQQAILEIVEQTKNKVDYDKSCL